LRKKVTNYFDLAAKIATAKDDKRSFLLSAIGVRSDGAMVRSINAPSISPNRVAHAEYRLSRKLDTGAIVYVCRIRLLDGKKAMARPCKSCIKVLKSRGVSKVYFTKGHKTWGCLDFDKNTESTFSRRH
jgi:tRNA(Arg) A34 adenosine deaminase TadA